jgi:hypothetical protein
MHIDIELPEGPSVVLFGCSHAPINGRMYSSIIIHTPSRCVSGVAICRANDTYKAEKGYIRAFGRALDQLYPMVPMPNVRCDIGDLVRYLDNQYNKEIRGTIWHLFLCALADKLGVPRAHFGITKEQETVCPV